MAVPASAERRRTDPVIGARCLALYTPWLMLDSGVLGTL
jgi:hypothetical protein